MAKGKHEKEKETETQDRSGGWKLANIAVTVSLFIGITVALLVLERPTVSYTEKRPLAAFPEFSIEKFFSGEYTDAITEWFDDTVPWRDGFKDISARIVKHMGISPGGVTIYGMPSEVGNSSAPENKPDPSVTENSGTGTTAEAGKDPGNTTVTDNAQNTTPAETTAPPFEVGAAQDMSESNGYLVYMNPADGRYYGIVLYAGGYNENHFIQYVNAFAEDLGDGIQTYVMVAPTSGEFYTPSNYAGYNASQMEDIQYIAAGLNSNIISIDCVTPLSQHLAEPIYCRTDHHWQPLGAYYAAQAFAKAAGVPFADISTFEERHVPGFLGTIYGETMSADLLNDPDDFVYYVPPNDFKAYYYDTAYNFDNIYPFFLKYDQEKYPGSAYSTFMGADNKIVRVETDVDNGRILAVFKDSYGNAEIPFYMNSFEEIYVLDIRYFDLNAIDFLKEHGVTDVLFSMNIHSAAGGNAEGIDRIRTQ